VVYSSYPLARFWIHNLDTGEDVEFPLSDLPKNPSMFGFITGYETREYKEQDPVNIKAAEKLAELYDALKNGVEPPLLTPTRGAV